jgi:diacylglycerol kinase (ATP)
VRGGRRSFSLAARTRSFRFAWRGIVFVVSSQHNAWIHAGATLAVIAAGLLLRVGVLEWALLVLAMGVVWMAEAFNTAIETLGDAVSGDEHPLLGLAKDASAAGVLLGAAAAAIIGCLVFVPRIASLIRGVR